MQNKNNTIPSIGASSSKLAAGINPVLNKCGPAKSVKIEAHTYTEAEGQPPVKEGDFQFTESVPSMQFSPNPDSKEEMPEIGVTYCSVCTRLLPKNHVCIETLAYPYAEEDDVTMGIFEVPGFESIISPPWFNAPAAIIMETPDNDDENPAPKKVDEQSDLKNHVEGMLLDKANNGYAVSGCANKPKLQIYRRAATSEAFPPSKKATLLQSERNAKRIQVKRRDGQKRRYDRNMMQIPSITGNQSQDPKVMLANTSDGNIHLAVKDDKQPIEELVQDVLAEERRFQAVDRELKQLQVAHYWETENMRESAAQEQQKLKDKASGPELSDNSEWFEYQYRVYDEKAWFVHYKKCTAYVRKDDIPILEKFAPHSYSNVAMHSARTKILDHFRPVLTRMIQNNDLESERKRYDGLSNWIYRELKHRSGRRKAAAKGNSEFCDDVRKANRWHDILALFPVLSWRFWQCVLIGAALALSLVFGHWSWYFAAIWFTLFASWIVIKDPRIIYDPGHFQQGATFSMVRKYPKESAVLEEYVKLIPGMPTAIGIFESAKYCSWSPYYFHTKIMQLPFEQRIRKHVEWNDGNNPLREQYVEFVKNGTELKILESFLELQKTDEMPTSVQSYGPPLPSGPDKLLTPIVPDPLGTPMLVEETCGPWYAYSFFVTPLYKNGNTLTNNTAACNVRLLANNRPVPSPSCMRLLDKTLHALLETIPVIPPDPEAWLRDCNPKQKGRKRNNDDQLLRNQEEFENRVFLKTDELICDHGDKRYGRVIVNTTDQNFAALGPSIQAMQKSWATRFSHDSEPVMIPDPCGSREDFPVFLYFADHATSETIEAFINRAISGPEGLHLAVLGDDTVAFLNIGGKLFKYEGDYSKFDKCQGKELLMLMYKSLQVMYPDVRQTWMRMYNEGMKMRKGEYKDHFFQLPEKNWLYLNMGISGENATCLRNSIINATVTINIFQFVYYKIKLEGRGFTNLGETWLKNSFLRYGLEVKPIWRGIDDPYPVTFLKGAILERTDGTVAWVRLFSFLGKFGKSMRHIDVLDTRPLGYQERVAQFLYNMYRGYGDMSHVSPQFTRIHDHLLSLQTKNYEYHAPKWEMWQVEQTNTKNTNPVTLSSLSAYLELRYGLAYDDFVHIVNLICAVTVYPTLISCPAMYKMVLTDY
jgi:hypothetical protein